MYWWCCSGVAAVIVVILLLSRHVVAVALLLEYVDGVSVVGIIVVPVFLWSLLTLLFVVVLVVSCRRIR